MIGLTIPICEVCENYQRELAATIRSLNAFDSPKQGVRAHVERLIRRAAQATLLNLLKFKATIEYPRRNLYEIRANPFEALTLKRPRTQTPAL